MSERPFMQLYVSDYLGDTQHLSTEQHGAYLLLLMAMWNADGSLPRDDIKLARVARLSLKRWHQIGPDVLAFFEQDGEQISQPRMTKELQKVMSKINSRTLAGGKGGRAKALRYNNQALAKATSLLPVLPPYARAVNHIEPEPQEDFNNDVNPTDGRVVGGGIVISRKTDGELFRACEKMVGIVVPEWKDDYRFPSHLVERAQKAKEGALE